MKTAMQELLDSLCQKSKGSDGEARLLLNNLIWFVKEELLEKEKRQIKDACKAGNTSFVLDADLEIFSDEYYNQTYKP